MAKIDLDGIMQELECAIHGAAAQAELQRSLETIGTAAGGLVTARVRAQQLEIDIHVLAKRRLERDELGEAIVEAVNMAEHSVLNHLIGSVVPRRDGHAGGDAFSTKLAEMMRGIGGLEP
jgi:hypothetical protein